MSSTETHPYAGREQPNTSNATWFNPYEMAENEYWETSAAFRFTNKRKWWIYLEEMNQGTRNGKRTNKPYWTYRDNSDLIANVADQIGTTDMQAQRASRIFFHLHGDYISGIRKDATAVGVVAFVIENDELDKRPLHPQTEDDCGKKVADRLADQFGLNADVITSTYGKVQHHLRISESPSQPPSFDSKKMDRRGLYEGLNENEEEVTLNLASR